MLARSLSILIALSWGCSASHLALPDASVIDAGAIDAAPIGLDAAALDAGPAPRLDAEIDAGPREVCTCWDATRGGPVCYPRDSAPCGPECSPCDVPANAGATCDAFGFCSFECAPGFARTAEGCVPADIAPPRPLSPLSTQRLSTRRPTLRFARAPGVDGMVVDLCRDRDCASVIERERVDGDTYQAPYDLGPGAWFFRAFGRIGDTVGTTSSAIWEIFVPQADGPRALAWGTSHDVDGDGYDDVLIARAESIRLHRGGPSGVSPQPVLTLPGGQARIVGDLDADGFADLVHWSRHGGPWVQVGYGGVRAESIELDPVQGEESSGYYERTVLAGGDLDGDGFGDLVVGCELCGGRQGQVWIHRGGRDGISSDAAAARVVTSPLGHTYNYFGRSGGGGADVDGDGYGDLVVASPGEPGGLFVIRGRPRGPWWTEGGTIVAGDPIDPDLRFDAAEAWGTLATPPADLDGDGRAELAAYVASLAVLRTWSGAALPSEGPTQPLEPCAGDGYPIVTFGAVLGDADGDGTLDRALHTCVDRLLIERAGAFVVEPVAAGKRLTGLTAVGDVDADGLADLLLESAADTFERRAPVIVFGTRAGEPPRIQRLPVE